MTEETGMVVREINSQVVHADILSPFGSHHGFDAAQRMAKMLCTSSLVPEIYRGNGKIADCVIALEMSSRIGASVLSVMQSLYIVHGKPGWSSTFLIACINACGRFSPLRYDMSGDENSDSWGCRAWAYDLASPDREKLIGPLVTIGMAKKEGWYQKNGSKWQTIPELMLRYRAATFFSRLYAPEIGMGIKTDNEIRDIGPEDGMEVSDPMPTRRNAKDRALEDAEKVGLIVPEGATAAEIREMLSKAKNPKEKRTDKDIAKEATKRVKEKEEEDDPLPIDPEVSAADQMAILIERAEVLLAAFSDGPAGPLKRALKGAKVNADVDPASLPQDQLSLLVDLLTFEAKENGMEVAGE